MEEAIIIYQLSVTIQFCLTSSVGVKTKEGWVADSYETRVDIFSANCVTLLPAGDLALASLLQLRYLIPSFNNALSIEIMYNTDNKMPGRKITALYRGNRKKLGELLACSQMACMLLVSLLASIVHQLALLQSSVQKNDRRIHFDVPLSCVTGP